MSPEAMHLVICALIILLKIVCFIIGYLIIKLGYKLIASGVQGEFKFSSNFGGFKADLASVSPGLLFVLLGVVLIGFAMFVEKSATLDKRPRTSIEDTIPPIPSSSELDSYFDGKEGKNETPEKK